MHSSTVDSLHKKAGMIELGIGGWKCSCCSPCPKSKKFYIRLAKHRAKRENEKFDRIAEGE